MGPSEIHKARKRLKRADAELNTARMNQLAMVPADDKPRTVTPASLEVSKAQSAVASMVKEAQKRAASRKGQMKSVIHNLNMDAQKDASSLAADSRNMLKKQERKKNNNKKKAKAEIKKLIHKEAHVMKSTRKELKK